MTGDPDYKLYFIGEDGRFCGVRDLVASDDEEAARLAQGILAEAGEPAAELWQRARRVTVFAQAKRSETALD